MGRVILLLIFWLGGEVGAFAQEGIAVAEPAEGPPPGFSARQYIDSAGCVFVRDGSFWRPRLDNGMPICGYPPTPSAVRQPRQLPADAGVAADMAMPGMGATEARLLAAVAGEMRRGDFAADPVAATVLQTGNTSDQFGRQLAAGIVIQPALAYAAVGALSPSRRLCDMLGVGAAPSDQAGRLGVDPAMGYCAGNLMAMPGYVYRDSVGQPGAMVAPARPVRIMTGQSAGRGRNAVGGQHRAGAPSVRKNADSAKVRSKSGDARKPRLGQIEAMIPAGARWLEVGSYADPASAEAVQRRLMAAGFPAGRGGKAKGPFSVLAGPYSTRQAIVSAHDRLTRAGFAPLRPR